MAVLPTPGSPIRTGLFFVRRRQDLDDAPDLLVAADDRVELAGARLGGQVAAVLLERLVGALGVRRRDALAAADALERLEDGLAGRRAWRSSSGLRLAADLGDAEQQVLGRDVLVAEAAGLRLGPVDDRAWRAGRGSASRPAIRARRASAAASSPRNAGRSTPRRRSVSAGMPSSGSTSARAGARRRGSGSASRWAVAWAATMASWAFWVNRSSCMSQVSQVGARGSGWSTRSRKASAAAARPRRTGRSAGRPGRWT